MSQFSSNFSIASILAYASASHSGPTDPTAFVRVGDFHVLTTASEGTARGKQFDVRYQWEDQNSWDSGATYAMLGTSGFNRDGVTTWDDSWNTSIAFELGYRRYFGNYVFPRSLTWSLGISELIPIPISGTREIDHGEFLGVGTLRWEAFPFGIRGTFGFAGGLAGAGLKWGIGLDVPLQATTSLRASWDPAKSKMGPSVLSRMLGMTQTASDIKRAIVKHQIAQDVCKDTTRRYKWNVLYYSGSNKTYKEFIEKRVNFMRRNVSKPTVDSLASKLRADIRMGILACMKDSMICKSVHFGELSEIQTVDSVLILNSASAEFWKITLDYQEQVREKLQKRLANSGIFGELVLQDFDNMLDELSIRFISQVGGAATKDTSFSIGDLIQGACTERKVANGHRKNMVEGWIAAVALKDSTYAKRFVRDPGCLEKFGPERSKCLALADEMGVDSGLESKNIDSNFISDIMDSNVFANNEFPNPNENRPELRNDSDSIITQLGCTTPCCPQHQEPSTSHCSVRVTVSHCSGDSLEITRILKNRKMFVDSLRGTSKSTRQSQYDTLLQMPNDTDSLILAIDTIEFGDITKPVMLHLFGFHPCNDFTSGNFWKAINQKRKSIPFVDRASFVITGYADSMVFSGDRDCSRKAGCFCSTSVKIKPRDSAERGNVCLAWNRAKAVKNLLIHLGVDSSQITIQSGGVWSKIGSKRVNRGVDIEITSNPEDDLRFNRPALCPNTDAVLIESDGSNE